MCPVAFNTAYLKQMMPYLNDDMILTDVGSVKTPIHDEIIRLGLEDYFIGGAPDGRFRKEWFCQFQTNPDRERLLCSHPFRQSSEKKVDAYASFVESLRALPDRTGLS